MHVKGAKKMVETIDYVFYAEHELESREKALKEFREKPVDMDRPLWTMEQDARLVDQVLKAKHRAEDIRDAVAILKTEHDPLVHKGNSLVVAQRRAVKILGL